jgi:hypothetical protein
LLHQKVLALVESTLERTNPGPAFTSVMLAGLPGLGGGMAAVAAGAVAAKGSAAAKAATSAGGSDCAFLGARFLGELRIA